MSRTIITAEIGYKDISVSPNTTATLYVASEGFVTDHTDTLADTYFAGRLDGEVRYKLRLSTGFWGGKSSVGIGALEVLNDDGNLDSWLDFEFRDHAVVIKQHTEGESYNSATVLLNAIIERMDIVNEKRLRFVIRDPAAALVVPITTATYDDTTDAEGVFKPIPFGKPELVRPVLIDEDTLQYAVSDVTILQVETVYDQGVSVGFNRTDTGFYLPSAPAGKVTATVLTSGAGNDPFLTTTPIEFLITGESRTMNTFNSGTSPQTSMPHGFSAVNHSRAASDGGKHYFEMRVEAMHYESGPSVGEPNFDVIHDGAVAVGIQSTAISNPQDLDASGMYCLVIGNSSASSNRFEEYHAWNNGSNDDNDSAGNETIQMTVGVKVNFDTSPMTIEYLVRNVQDETTFGPWGIISATYSPVLGVSSERFNDVGENSATIRLIEDDFVYSIPSGYSAWSAGITADTTFSKLAESITDRLSDVTFDSASVAEIDGLVHSSPETAYTYSYYLDKSTTASKLLNWAMSSIGGFWFVNRLGEVQVGQLTAPGSSVLTIDDVKIIGDISIAADNARDLSNGLGALKNWSPYRESEVSSAATEAFKQQISRMYQSEYRSATAVAGSYDHADGAPFPISLLSDSIAAQVEADRSMSLYSEERQFYTVPIALDAVDFDSVMDDIGNTYTIDSDRFGLSGGKDLVLIGIDTVFLKNELTLTLWG